MATDTTTSAPAESSRSGGAANLAARRLAVWIATVALALLLGTAGVWAAFSRRESGDLPEAIDQALARNDWPRGEKLARRYLQQQPANPQAILLLGRALGGRKAFTQCAELLQTVPAAAPEHAEALLRAGQAWLMDYQRRRAESTWTACLAIQTDDLSLPAVQQECRHQLAHIYSLERRRDPFREITWQMVQHALPRDRHVPLAMRVRYQFILTTPNIAISQLQPALDRDPQDTLTRRAIGIYQLESTQIQAARATLYRSTQDDPELVIAWETWLECLDRLGDSLGLEQAVRKLPQSADASAQCWKYRAIVARAKGDLDAAIEAARHALTLEPLNAEVHHRLAELLVQAGRRDEAQEHVTRHQQLQQASESLRDALDAYDQYWAAESTRRPDLAYALAETSERLGQHADALAWYRAALSESPADQRCIAALQRLLVQPASASPTNRPPDSL